MCATVWKVAATGTGVWRKERVADKDGLFADNVADAGGRVARRVQHAHLERAELKLVAFGKEPIELRAVGRQVVQVVERLERRLHRLDVFADAVRRVGALGLQVLRTSQVICAQNVRMFGLRLQVNNTTIYI